MNEATSMDLVFHAMASRTRRHMMDLIRQTPGLCVNEVCEHFETSRVAVMKHLNVLVKARLVISRKTGRKRQYYFNAVPIQMIYDRWTTEYSAFWASQAVDLKYKIEGAESSDVSTGKVSAAKSKVTARSAAQKGKKRRASPVQQKASSTK